MTIKNVFGKALILSLNSREDCRGRMTMAVSHNAYKDDLPDFTADETRIYNMPSKGTFFGIHYRDESEPMARTVTVAAGRGNDYLIDLRKDSPTYLKWEKIELSSDNALSVYIPAGIGHAFQSTEDGTVLLYTTDKCGSDAFCNQVNYEDGLIGLQLDLPVAAISDYDKDAPFIDPSRG